ALIPHCRGPELINFHLYHGNTPFSQAFILPL
ncbi:unnamed protein product, partial [marine sediment metagenome]